MQLITMLYLGVFSVMLFSAVMWLSVYVFNREKINQDPEISDPPGLTFLVPAYNEEEYVSECLDSLLNQNYPGEIDVIAINDGSEDSTLEEMEKYSDEIKIIDKPNTGKANSMNQALDQVETELVASMDADSVADENFARNMVGYFREEGVKGVTPALKVRDPDTWAEKMIWTEFAYNILLRKLFSILNAQWVMPGPGSVYETEYLKQLGGWDEETLTEDMEVAFRMFKNGAKLKSTTNAFTLTESPPDFTGLFRQRLRWYRGYINNCIRYKELWFNPNYGNLGLIMLPFNVVLTLTLIFLALHMVYRLFDTGIQMINTYLLIGFASPVFNLSIQKLSVFHVFYLVTWIFGLGILVMSIKTSDESIKPWKRKKHYGLFLAVYGPVYAVFWIAAGLKELGSGGKKW